MDKMFTFQIDEQPAVISSKRSKVLKLFAVFVAVIMIWLLILTGVICWTFQPRNSVQPLTQNTTVADQDFPLPQNTTEVNQADPLTFSFQNSLSKSTLSHGNFTCSIKNSELECSNSFKKWNNLTKSTIQIEFLENKLINSIFYKGQLTFDQNNNVIYKVREKYQMHQDIYFNFDELKAETIFRSKDFDWNQQVSFGSEKNTISANESFGHELDKIQYPCPIDQFKHNLCYILEPSVKKMTNFAKAVFGIKTFNLTWTMGITPDWHMVASEYEMIGKLEDGTTPRNIANRIAFFDETLKNFCLCVKTAKAWSTNVQQYCSNYISERSPQFQEVWDTNLCPLELEERVNEYIADLI